MEEETWGVDHAGNGSNVLRNLPGKPTAVHPDKLTRALQRTYTRGVGALIFSF